ncbi:MAG: glycosyltransferase [Propionibacteriaceae bacterium]
MTYADESRDTRAHRNWGIVVPAHNEETVIERSLAAIDVEPLPAGTRLSVVVVVNGSSDRTADLARAWTPRQVSVQVVESAVPSKVTAVRQGLASLPAGPVIILDADVVVSPGTLAAVLEVVTSEPDTIASPRMLLDAHRSAWPVRFYYRVWEQLPYARTGLIGVGVMGLGEGARAVVATIPDVINDDGWIRRSFAPAQRRTADGCSLVTAAVTTGALLSRRARVASGNDQLDRELGESDAGGTSARVLVAGFRARAYGPIELATFVTLTLLARGLAGYRRSRGRVVWGTDTTSREVQGA